MTKKTAIVRKRARALKRRVHTIKPPRINVRDFAGQPWVSSSAVQALIDWQRSLDVPSPARVLKRKGKALGKETP